MGFASGRTILILHYLKAQRSTFPAMQTLQLGSHADEVERVTNAVMRRLMDGNHNMCLSLFKSSKKLSQEDYKKSVSHLRDIYFQMWQNATNYENTRSDAALFTPNAAESLYSIPLYKDNLLQLDPLFSPEGIIWKEKAGFVRDIDRDTFEEKVMGPWRQEIEVREKRLFQNATNEQSDKYFGAKAGDTSNEASNDTSNESSIAGFRQKLEYIHITKPSRDDISDEYKAT